MRSEGLRILDGHVHVFGDSLDCVRDMLAIERTFHYDVCNFLSCEAMDDAAQNALGIYLKLVAPECYAFGGFTYRCAYDFREELDALRNVGFDGVKMIEQKPNVRKHLGVPMNDPRYDGLYAAMERDGVPLLAHVADPAENWDRARIPQWAFDAGAYYGDPAAGFPGKELLTGEAEDVAARFPRLRLILAHLFFLSDDLPRLTDFMARHPAVCLDLTSGTEMYFNMGRAPEAWRAFFLRFQDRLIYGTDNANLTDATAIENAQITCGMQERFLTESGPIAAWDKRTAGLSLPEDVCRKICRENFLRLAGERPRPIDRDAAADYLARRLRNPAMRLKAGERRVIENVLKLL